MCTRTHHDHLVSTAWGSLLNARPWPDADLEIAECPECKSTQHDILTRELAIAAREGLEWDALHNLSAAFGRLAFYIQIRKEAA